MAAFLVRYMAGFPYDKGRSWEMVLIGNPTHGSVGDITFLLAQIATTDSKRDYTENLHSLGPEPAVEAFKPLVVASLQRLDGWYRRLDLMRSSLGASACVETFWLDFTAILAGRNASTIASLPVLTSQLKADPDWRSVIDALDLDPCWHVDTPPRHTPDPGYVLSALSSATEALAAKAVAAVERSLDEIGDHPPHTGLLLAYLKLCTQLKDKLNRITERHLDFYLRDVLRLTPKVAANDVATVSFELAPQAKPCVLPAGSQLSAGNDAKGQPILFATDTPLAVTHATVRSLMAVRLRMSTSASAPGGGKAHVREVTGISAYPIVNSSDGFGRPSSTTDPGWPTFGAARGQSASLVGLSIRSPMFHLTEGQRTIDIVIRFVEPAELRRAVNAYIERVGDMTGSVDAKLTRCFQVIGSTSTGFVTATQETVFDRNRGTLRFLIALPAASPALAAPPGPSAGATHGLPCVRILLDPDAPAYGYSYFKTLTLRDIAIKVGVKGLTTIDINGSSRARVDATKPFAPFGNPAIRGAALTLTHPDLADKPLTQVAIGMRWSNLPTPPDGLAHHYAGYEAGITDASFRLAITGLVDHSWVPLGTGDVPMFAEPGAETRSEAAWSFSTRGVWDGAGRKPGSLTRAAAAMPMIKLTLCAPDYGFGQTLYPTVLGRIVMAQATGGEEGADRTSSLPKPPFVPLIDALSIDYYAAATISAGVAAPDPIEQRAAIYAFDPFGNEVPLTNAALLPAYPAQGYLFLGLDGLEEAEPLSFFFNIEPRAAEYVVGGTSVDAKRRESLQVCCLSADRWRPLTDDNILADATEALSRPGLLHLQLPRMARNRGPAFDPRLVWLRIAADGDPETYGRTLGIECNGVSATRLDAGEAMIGPRMLPPGSITKLVRANAGLTALRQGLATRGGTSSETSAQFRIRVSERLRHKNRAILSHDYEAMVLDRFPSIGDAKCFGAAGSVTVVVAPLRHEGKRDATTMVPEYELQAILDYLRKRSSPSIRQLIVRNPTFEPVRAIAWIQLTAGDVNTKVRSVRAAIDRFIAPWVGQPSIAMTIGTPHIDLSGLRGTLVSLPFVTCATGLSITHLHSRRRREIGATGADADTLFYVLDDTTRDGGKRSHIRPAQPQSVLVPAHHHLRIVGNLGIGYGAIDDDFFVGSVPGGRSVSPFLRPPRRAGIGNLGIGDDFVVRARRCMTARKTLERRA